MRFKCSSILKALTALVLAVLMLFSTVATSFAATIDLAETGSTIYYDFTEVSGGVNYWDGDSLEYNGSGGGTIITGGSASNGSTVVSKTNTGNWTNMNWSTPPSGYDIISVRKDGEAYDWRKTVTFSQDAVLFFKLDKWFNNSGCYHYAKFTKLDGTTQVVALYNLSSYTTDNSAELSTASTGADDTVFFATLPAGTYFKGAIYRNNNDNTTLTGAYNYSYSFQVTVDDKNQLGDIANDTDKSTSWSWSWVDHASTASLTTDADDPVIGDEITLTPSINNTLLNTLDSTSYTVTLDGSDATEGTDYVIDGNTFTPLKAGEFGITASATYHAKGFTTKTASADSSEVTVTVSAGSSPVIDTFTIDSGASATLKIGETATLASTTSNAVGYTVYYTTDSDKISIDGTTVKALAPVTNATITASLSNDGGTTAVDTATVTVSVSTPAVNTWSYASSGNCLVGRTLSVYTVPTVTNTNVGATVTYTYTLANSNAGEPTTTNTYIDTLNTGTGQITAKNTHSALTSTAQSAYCYATITYNGVTYKTAPVAASYSVYGFYLKGFDTTANNGWDRTDAKLFKYDTDRSVWTNSQTLTAKTYTNDTEYGFKVMKYLNGTENYYDASSKFDMTRESNDNTNTALDSNSTGNIGIVADVAGTYVFDLTISAAASAVPTNIKPHYPQAVTYNANGKTTTSFPSNTYVTYNTEIGSAPSEHEATGYTFVRWVNDPSSDSAFDFANTKITGSTTIYAIWSEDQAGISLRAKTDETDNSKTGGSIFVDGVSTDSIDGVGIVSHKTLVATVTPASGYLFDGWETDGVNAAHILLYVDSACSDPYDADDPDKKLLNTIYIRTDGTRNMSTANSIVRAKFVNGNRTVCVDKMAETNASGFTTSAASSLSPSLSGAGAAVVGNTVALSASTSVTYGGDTYQFVGWYSAASAQTTAENDATLVSGNASYSFTLAFDSDLYYYAMYKKVLYITLYNTYIDVSEEGAEDPVWEFYASPAKKVEVYRNDILVSTYNYAVGTIDQRGEDNHYYVTDYLDHDDEITAADHIVSGTTATYYEGNKLAVLAGDEVKLYYSSLTKSDTITGVFFENARRYSTELEPDDLYNLRSYVGVDASGKGTGTDDRDSAFTYLAATTLYADANYYDSATAGTIGREFSSYAAKDGMDQDAHTVTWTIADNYYNIDLEIANKRRFIFVDQDGALIKHEHTNDYYGVGERIGESDAFGVNADSTATNATYTFDYSDVEFYTNKACTTTLDEVFEGNDIEIASSPVEGYYSITGTMPNTDIYVKLNIDKKYTIHLGTRMISDTTWNYTTWSKVAKTGIYYTVGETTHEWLDNGYDTAGNQQVSWNSGAITGVTAGDTVDLKYTFWDLVESPTEVASTAAYSTKYMFCGWYEGDADGPFLNQDPISDRQSYPDFEPIKNTYIYAVGTRDLYINGSKYITGKAKHWNVDDENPDEDMVNLKMSFDPDYSETVGGTTYNGRYYWTITPEIYSGVENGVYYVGNTNSGNKKYYADNTKMGNSFFRIMDSATGNTGFTFWSKVASFDATTSGVQYGKLYYNGDNETRGKQYGNGYIAFYKSGTYSDSDYWSRKETQYDVPITIYAYPSGRIVVEASPICPNIYLSNGYSGIDTDGDALNSGYSISAVSTTAGAFDVTDNNNDMTLQSGYEGKVKSFKVNKKQTTDKIRVTKAVSSNSYKIAAFVTYNIATDEVEAYTDTANKVHKTTVTYGGTDYPAYYADITVTKDQSLYIVPIIEESDADMTLYVDATKLDTDEWGDFVSCFAFYKNNAGNACGAFPGQIMIPTDGNCWVAHVKSTKGGNELESVMFANYFCREAGGNKRTWACGYQVFVNEGDPAKRLVPRDYNSINAGDAVLAKTNFQAETYDYREPVAMYLNRNTGDGENLTMTFALKDGNDSNILSLRHNELTGAKIPTALPEDKITHINSTGQIELLSIPEDEFEYLTNAKGDIADLNGEAIEGEPTPSYYIVVKGMVSYSKDDESLKRVFYSKYNYDSVNTPTEAFKIPTVTYGKDLTTDLDYAVQWYVYNASGGYITNMLSAGYADHVTTKTDNDTNSLIAQALIDQGYGVVGRAVYIAYDKPRLCYNKGNVSGGPDDNVANGGSNFECYRFCGQWYVTKSSTEVTINVGVGTIDESGKVKVFTPEGEAPKNVSNFGDATAVFDRTKVTPSHTVKTDANKDFVTSSLKDASQQAIKLTASATNFYGWYFSYDNGVTLTAANESDSIYYPSFSKDITYYAIYEKNATYSYQYTGRESGSLSYNVSGGRMSDDELSTKKVNVNTRDNLGTKAPGANIISIFKKIVSFSNNQADYDTDNAIDYILKITNAATITDADYDLTYYFLTSPTGSNQLHTLNDVVYNHVANIPYSITSQVLANAPEGKVFRGWYTAENGGTLLSIYPNYGMRIVKDTTIYAQYGNAYVGTESAGWHVYIEDQVISKEMASVDSGTYYNDTIIRVTNDGDVNATIPSTAEAGVLIIKSGTDTTIDTSARAAKLESYATNAKLNNGVTARITKDGATVTKLCLSGSDDRLTMYNRADFALRSDYSVHGQTYSAYAYLKIDNGNGTYTCYFSEPVGVTAGGTLGTIGVYN